jgi:hypothetical protein
MQNDRTNRKIEVIRSSLEAVDSNIVYLVGGFCNWNPNKDCLSRSRGDELQDPSVNNPMVPCSPGTHKDEPNYFHF